MIEEIQNQGPNLKRHMNVKAEIDKIRGQIKKNWMFVGQLRSKYTNSEPKTRMKISMNFGANNWVWQGWNYMKLKVWRQLWVQLKAIGRIGTQLKFAKSQIQNLKWLVVKT